MPTNPVAENVLGTIGTICWTIQLVPQLWKSWHQKSTDGLSYWLVFLWAVAAGFLGIYNVSQNLNIPLIVQPQLFATLSIISWGQCMYYGKNKSPWVSFAWVAGFMTFLGGFEAGMVFAVRHAFLSNNRAPVDFFGVMSSILLSAGLFPQYYEIYKHGEVVGISIPFMLIDLSGGVFSDLSLAFKPKFDVFAGIAYSLVVVLDGVVIVAALILNPRMQRRRKREAAARAEVEATATLTMQAVEH